ncbi:MAG TPA: UDP-3-O-(3-hydroxymyristoyl)glucosamine N-acyltransferase [Tepidisphaeraceae bacterium]|nr:UDP-3-O-(3-hydroxymyristoyl)glucosamine N-acyltransferase [Tepidisphaeraceae bacterium]
MKLTLTELAKNIGAQLKGNPSLEISGVAALEEAGPDQVSFLSNPKYEKQLQSTQAGAVIVGLGTQSDRLNLLHTNDPYFSFAKAVIALHGHRVHPFAGVHPKAAVEETATIGEGTVIYPGAYVGPRVRIGRDCILYPNVVVYEDCVIGDRVIVHAGAVIGHDGFGYATSQGVHHKIPQVGGVVIEDDVEIGANAAIQRAALGSTVIGQGTKIDSLVSIGHGSRIGAHGLLVSQVGVAGSTTIGHHVTLGGQVGVAGHLKIGSNVTAAAQAGITNDVADQEAVMGSPALPLRLARRVVVLTTQLPELLERIRHLEQQVGELGTEPK